MTQANDQPKPASATPVEQELGLVERLERYAAQRRAHPHIGAILGDCGTAAAEIARLRAELAEMTADRDSWADQASQRLQDALDLVAAERERCALELLTPEAVDEIANDGMRNAAGGIYATRVQEFAAAVQREFAREHGLRIAACGA